MRHYLKTERMKISTELMLKILNVVSWIIFIGLSVEAGGFITNAFFTLLLNPVGARHFWQQVDLSGLYYFDRGHFFAQALMICIVAVMKAYLFYVIVRALKKINMSRPFSPKMGARILKIAYVTFVIGLFSVWGFNNTAWLAAKGVKMPNIQDMRLGGGDVWLFMSVTLFVIAQIFKKGIELQTENELTV